MSDVRIPGLKQVSDYYSAYNSYLADLTNVYSHESNDKCYIFCFNDKGYCYVLDAGDEMQGIDVLTEEGYTLLSALKRYRVGNMYAQCTITYTTYAPAGGDQLHAEGAI